MAKTALLPFLVAASAAAAAATSLYDLSALDIDGNNIPLDFAGNVTVVINVASTWHSSERDYEIIKNMSAKYADQPVRFLLFPCNLFQKTEPWSQSRTKLFVEKHVNLKEAGNGNVLLFSKTNLNHVKCTPVVVLGIHLCSPIAYQCCPTNDPVYDYLQNSTAPGVIERPFGVIIVGKDGRPSSEEQIMYLEAQEELSAAIDGHLAAWSPGSPVSPLSPVSPVSPVGPQKPLKVSGGSIGLCLGGMALAALFMLSQVKVEKQEETSAPMAAPLLA